MSVTAQAIHLVYGLVVRVEDEGFPETVRFAACNGSGHWLPRHLMQCAETIRFDAFNGNRNGNDYEKRSPAAAQAARLTQFAKTIKVDALNRNGHARRQRREQRESSLLTTHWSEST